MGREDDGSGREGRGQGRRWEDDWGQKKREREVRGDSIPTTHPPLSLHNTTRLHIKLFKEATFEPAVICPVYQSSYITVTIQHTAIPQVTPLTTYTPNTTDVKGSRIAPPTHCLQAVHTYTKEGATYTYVIHTTTCMCAQHSIYVCA